MPGPNFKKIEEGGAYFVAENDSSGRNLDGNQLAELCLITQNTHFLDVALADQQKFKQISQENIWKMLNFIFQKLTLQRGREMIASARREERQRSSSPIEAAPASHE